MHHAADGLLSNRYIYDKAVDSRCHLNKEISSGSPQRLLQRYNSKHRGDTESVRR